MSVFLRTDGELSTAAFAGFEEGLLIDGTVAATDSAARMATAEGPVAILEIVSPPIRMAWGIENSSPRVLEATADCEAVGADLWSLRAPTTVASAAGEFAICVAANAVVAAFAGAAATEGVAWLAPTEFGVGCAAATCGSFADAERSSKRVGGAISTMTDGTGPCRVGEIAATTAGPAGPAP